MDKERSGGPRETTAPFTGAVPKSITYYYIYCYRIIKRNTPRRIRTPNLLVRSQTLYPVELWAHLMAEREGFEPSVGDYPYNRLAGGCLQPLGHLS